MDLRERRALVKRWLHAGVAAVDPEQLTFEALRGSDGPATVVAIGKAGAAMCRGAARALGEVSGVCVTNAVGDVPDGIRLLIGDHPVPAEGSFEAGDVVLDVAAGAGGRLIALISGGGSALCETPRPGVDRVLIQQVNSTLLDGGASIDDTNLVRRHLSAIKAGGVARAASVPVETLIVSDVVGGGPEVVASGPTIPVSPDPDGAIEIMCRHGINPSEDVESAIRAASDSHEAGPVRVLADGRTAAGAVAEAATSDGFAAGVADGWFRGDVESCLDQFLSRAQPGVLVAAGEPNVTVSGIGTGGRNSHAALLAARRIEGTADVFAAFATDGVDGRSDGAGGLVDGTTISRGGPPTEALGTSDSATYLERIGDLIRTGPTGTNVSDLWLLWRI
ncbi:MAG: DUF4147 domain-containing protein [Acidimicrobiia bacterium]|jgi:hydroxypyruvate reductase